MRHALRVSLPDRPGALAALTARLSRAGADIISLDVIDRDGSVAVDDICLQAEVDTAVLRAAVEDVPGLVVEALVPSATFRAVDAPVTLAAALVEEGRGAITALVDGLPGALWTTWAMALTRSLQGLEVLVASEAAPPLQVGSLPWLPLQRARRFEAAPWMPEAWRTEVALDAVELAAAPLGASGSALLVGRQPGVRFRAAELDQLAALARVAVAAEKQAGPRPVLVASARPRAVAI